MSAGQEVLDHFAAGRRCVQLHGCRGSHLALVLARLADRAERFSTPLVVVTADDDQARTLARDLTFFIGGPVTDPALEMHAVMHLPPPDNSPYAEISSDRVAAMHRLGVLYRLGSQRGGAAVVASAASISRRVIARDALVSRCGTLAEADEIDRDALVARLLEAGYGRASIVEDAGTFCVRGGIVDLFPLHRFPARIEFFGDMVESIRLFDPASQRALRPIEELVYHPVRETIATGSTPVRARILAAADEAMFPSRATKAVLDEVESGREFFGIEALTPAFHDGLVPVSDYVPEDALWTIVDPERVAAVLEEQGASAESGYRDRLDDGRLTFKPADFFVGADALAATWSRGPRLEVRLTRGDDDAAVHAASHDNADLAADLQRARAERGEEILGSLAGRLEAWQADGKAVVIAAGIEGHVERLESLLGGRGVETTVQRDVGAPALVAGTLEPGVHIYAGELSSGFRLDEGLVVLAEAEIFGPRARKRPARRRRGAGLGDLRELREDDHVVHSEHGVGRYRGLVKLEVQGVPGDFLLLEYAGGDRLYLPVYRMDQVQKFVGADGAAPKLDRLGGITWSKKKRKVADAVRQLGEELLQLYAQRQTLDGHAFDEPDATYREFEATFPFTETPDQADAIEAVLGDLTRGQPMDRLVCGDVGFGKTEVALRAAFIAAMAGRQVAVLAPTTVLAEQHHRTFSDRLSPYPMRVERVSRFRRPTELRPVLEDLAAGKVDVVVGTHRLLSKDVRFRDLGLLVIDEEQRFGVSHKEQIKRFRTQVDVLTLTATPIPRTLQMSMVGLREISVIATPPEDRLAIRTFVSRYEDRMIADAIRKELARGGQVFFVHNRVQDIERWAEKVSSLVPEARVVIGHGQMDARRLERVMFNFVSGESDILVCTTIIESGLDIPRANTMFVNRADRFGLAQLYQLRGRIGRSRHRAFCYLLVPGVEALSGDARARMEVLQRFTQLGSGFSIATYDLELRGAGDLLGARQSGHIASVGFDTYARILEEAVAELKGEPIHRESDPEINARVPCFIPDDYVEDTGQRLELYKRLSEVARRESHVHDLLAEIQDRYGPRPTEVESLGDLMIIKGLGALLGATLVDVGTTRLTITLGEQTRLDAARIAELVAKDNSDFRLTPDMRLIRTLDGSQQQQPLAAAKKILRDLDACASQPH